MEASIRLQVAAEEKAHKIVEKLVLDVHISEEFLLSSVSLKTKSQTWFSSCCFFCPHMLENNLNSFIFAFEVDRHKLQVLDTKMKHFFSTKKVKIPNRCSPNNKAYHRFKICYLNRCDNLLSFTFSVPLYCEYHRCQATM